MTNNQTDYIERQIVLRAPRELVWQALVDAKRFGAWFGARFDGAFVQGAVLGGHIEPTIVDADIAAIQAPHAGTPMRLEIVAIEPQQRFAFRWHPHPVDACTDYTPEPTTLVEFILSEAPGGVQLTVRESGFDAIPVARRAAAFEANGQGWTLQMTLVEKYVASQA